MKYLVVSEDPRIPFEIKENDDYVKMNLDEFLKATTDESGDGLSVEECVFFNIDSISEELYELLKQLPVNIKYYKFDNQTLERPAYIEGKITNYRRKEVSNNPSATPSNSPAPQQPQQTQQQPASQADSEEYTKVGVDILGEEEKLDKASTRDIKVAQWANLIDGESNVVVDRPRDAKPGRIILFGSSKGGTGKTFTCLLSAYRYAKTHPTERVALADFDIIDGQIGVTIAKPNPTLLGYYKQYKAGNRTFRDLVNYHVNSEHFSPNIDFYLAPEMDFPEVTNNNDFWKNVFELLITNYDVVFFDSGIDYLGKPPISKLYKIADKILITSNTSINSVSSIVRQLKTLAGIRKNNVFSKENEILSRLGVILTRVSPNSDINAVAMDAIKKYAKIIAAFTNMDEQISRTQWYQEWEAWDNYPKICEYLDRIVQ